ncbi:MAG: hypothetical protein JXB38_11575 [Anaerolineales bacterium]|nr:hypothetical protein [Anaerolineales bacterium]
MDAYDFQDDYDDDGGRSGPRNFSELIFNIGSLFFLLASALLAGYFLLIFFTPQSPLNFFPPDPVVVVTPRPSATPFPTSTPEPGQPLPANTLAAGETPIAVQPTVGETQAGGETPVGQPTEEVPVATLAPTDAETTPLPTPTDFVSNPPTPTNKPPVSDYSFVVADEVPIAMAADIFRPEYTCDESTGEGVTILAGQVFKDGAPLTQQNVVLYGPAQDSSGIQTAITGREDLIDKYGPAAFEFILDDQLIATEGLFSVQLVDQNNNALSQRIYFDTYDNCDENVIMINFTNIQ